MNENEQIQEMAELCLSILRALPCEQESGACELTTCRDCNALNAAKALYNADYRKVERGEWIGTREAFAPHPYVYNCSVCGFKISHCAKMAYKFCANCGADMRVATDIKDGHKTERI